MQRWWFLGLAVSALATGVKPLVMATCAHSRLRRVVTWMGTGRDGAIALTFDDGPTAPFTLPVLDILGRYGVRATFFAIGKLVERNPAVFDSIVEAGHEIGNHTYHHSMKRLADEVRTAERVYAKHGVSTRLFRPPYGKMSATDLAWLARHGYQTVLWSHDTRDSLRSSGRDDRHPSPETIVAGDIVIMHDDNPLAVAELETLIVTSKRKGLRFVTLSELLERAEPFASLRHARSRPDPASGGESARGVANSS